MRAISVFSLEFGTSTRWCFAAAALRIQVKKSAIGSVCIILLPTRFRYAGNFSLERHTAKTDSAHLKLANITARAATAAAAVTATHLEFLFLERLGNFCGPSDLLLCSFFTKREAEPFEQLAAFFIVFRGGGQGDVHALDFVHAGVIDFRKNQLILQAHGIVPAAVEGIWRQSAKVANARQHHVAQAIEKFVH